MERMHQSVGSAYEFKLIILPQLIGSLGEEINILRSVDLYSRC